MNDLDPLDSNSASDASFVARLRRIAPAESSVAAEEMMFRAGFESARNQRADSQPRWLSFALGMGSGALAAGLVWFCTGLPFLSGVTHSPPDLAKTSSSGPTSGPMSVSPTQEVRDSRVEAQESLVMTPPANPFLRQGELDLVRDSLNQIAKRQWDQRRLSERTQWVSSRSATNNNVESEASELVPQSSLWQIRNQAAPQQGL